MKWGGAVVSVVLVVVWVGSAWWDVEWMGPGGSSIGVDAGCLHLRGSWLKTVGHESTLLGGLPFGIRDIHAGWTIGRAHDGFDWWPSSLGFNQFWSYEFPVWPMIVGVLIATVAAWRLDALARRRDFTGLCPKCNYDRTGLAVGAVCPECGTPSRLSVDC